jgi:hypothetical protein
VTAEARVDVSCVSVFFLVVIVPAVVMYYVIVNHPFSHFYFFSIMPDYDYQVLLQSH